MLFGAKIGLRAYLGESDKTTTPKWVEDRNKFTESLHLARAPCPASCGSRCPNHHCPAKNENQPFKKWYYPPVKWYERKSKNA